MFKSFIDNIIVIILHSIICCHYTTATVVVYNFNLCANYRNSFTDFAIRFFKLCFNDYLLSSCLKLEMSDDMKICVISFCFFSRGLALP